MPTKPKVSKDLIWANEILLVHENLGREIDDEILTTSSARRVHRWLKEDEKNEFKFITDTVPKAAKIIQDNAPKDVSDAVRDIDVKTIAELQRCLSAAVKASQASIN